MRTNTKELIPVLESLFATDEKFESYAEEHHLADLVNANLGVTYFVPTYTSEGLALAIKKDLPRMPLILPILFENKLNGTSLLLTAGTISRYQRKKEGDGFSCGMSLYLRGGIAAGATRNSEEQYYRFLNKGTLRILMDFGFDQQSEVAVTERLAENSVSPPQQFHPIDSFGMFYSKADHCDYLRIDSRYKSDDRFFGGRYAEYEYDNYCYDQRHSRSLRIYNGCSFAIDFQEFGYLTTYKNLRLFKVEGPLEFLCELTPWQLYIPGIGYWIIDIREDNEGKYFEPNITEPIFLVNGYSIYEYANLKSGKN